MIFLKIFVFLIFLIFVPFSTPFFNDNDNSSSSLALMSRRDYYGSSSSDSPSYHHPGVTGNKGLISSSTWTCSIFEIALTALAFLSFGLLLLNLLLNTFLFLYFTKMTNPITSTGTNGIVTNTMTSLSTRNKRSLSAFELYIDPFTRVNTIAKAVLNSIQAFSEPEPEEKNPNKTQINCIREKIFCEGNKQAQIIGKGFQFLMPAYSLGATYLTKKSGLHNELLNYAKSIILGIEEQNCNLFFDNCYQSEF